jgi:hypothetical protein
MKRGACVWLVAAAIAGGCGRSEEPDGPPPEGSVDPRPAWKELLAQAGARATERPPLFEPGTPGDAMQEYTRVPVPVPDQLRGELDSVLAHPETFAGASAGLRELAASPWATAQGDAVLAGASRIQSGRVSADVVDMLRGGPARTALLSALARGAAGNPGGGARLALAVARMGHDAARGGALEAAMSARVIERQALSVLRTLAAHPKLPVAELPVLMTALGRLASSRPPIAAAMTAEIDATAARLLADEQRAGIESGTHPDAALNALLEERKVTVELATHAGKPLPAQQSWFEGRACKISGAARACKELGRYLVAAALAEAHARATQIALAARLEARGGDQPGAPPLDPVTGKAFEVVDAEGAKVIRRGASPLDKEPGAEPRDVPMT